MGPADSTSPSPVSAPPADGLGNTRFLREHLQCHAATCPACRSDLRDLVVARCPTCRLPLVLALGSAEPYLGAWIALLPAVLMPAGVGVVFLLLLVRALLERVPGTPPTLVLVFIAYAVLCMGASAVAVLARRRFLLLKRTTQIAVTGAAWAALLGMALLLLQNA